MTAVRWTRVELVRADRRIDIAGPGEDSAREVGDVTEPLPDQELSHLRASAPRLAHDYDLLMRVQFGQSRRNLAHRDMEHVRNARCLELPLLPHVEDEWPGAGIPTGFELLRGDLVYHGYRLKGEPGRPPGVLERGDYRFEQTFRHPAVLRSPADQAGFHDGGVAHDHEQPAADFELTLETIVIHR